MIKTNKKAAMEMTIGTMVTIVLLVAVLVMILFFITRITESGIGAIDGIDSAVKTEIDKLFSKDSSKKIIIYPESRKITIKKGEDHLGFGFSIRNTGEEDSFSYDITAVETGGKGCDLRLSEADGLISLGKQKNSILISAGTVMEYPIFVRFDIPDTTPPCEIRYAINVEKSGQIYGASMDVDLSIEGE
tara:strand:+ start:844 stop:1410 length:567 start_codon:yes stop_codon:yes gene_type:complete